jgi:hypothetical protein
LNLSLSLDFNDGAAEILWYQVIHLNVIYCTNS